MRGELEGRGRGGRRGRVRGREGRRTEGEEEEGVRVMGGPVAPAGLKSALVGSSRPACATLPSCFSLLFCLFNTTTTPCSAHVQHQAPLLLAKIIIAHGERSSCDEEEDSNTLSFLAHQN